MYSNSESLVSKKFLHIAKSVVKKMGNKSKINTPNIVIN